MGWEFNEHHVRPNVYYWSPKAYKERQEVKTRREEAQKSYLQAKKQIEEGDLDGAEHSLECAIAAWPDNPRYLLAMAEFVCDQRKDPERALAWHDQVIEAEDTAAHRVARAHALSTLGCLDEALQDVESALAGADSDATKGLYLKQRALLRERRGAYLDASQDYSQAIPLLKAEGLPVSECIFNRGYCHRLLGNPDECLKDFEAALLQAPSVIAIKTALGCKYLNKKRYKDALDAFNVVANFKRESAAAANNLALAQYLLATADEAEAGSYGRKNQRKAGTAATPGQNTARPGGTQQHQATGSAGGAASADDDELSDMDEEWCADGDDASQPARKRTANEDPKQWVWSMIQGGLRRASEDPSKRSLLEYSLANFHRAMELYNDDAARQKSQAKSDGDTHAVHEGEAADIKDGYLLILTNKVRVPGSALIHDREIEDGEIMYNRGLAHLALGRLAEAESDFQEALRSHPTHAHYPHYRAVVHARKGELREAVQWNHHALSLNPAYFPALMHLGLILHLKGRNAEAIQRLDSALGLQPKNWQVMEARGRVLQELDRHQEALPSLRDALHYLDPDEPPSITARLHYAIAQSAISTHNPDLLRSALKEARLHGQDPASVYNLRGLLAHSEKRLVKAVKYMSRAVTLAPDEALFVYDRAQVLLDLEDFTAAIEDITSALKLLPACPSLHYDRAMAYYGMGNERLALQDFEECARLLMAKEEDSSSTSSQGQPGAATTSQRSSASSIPSTASTKGVTSKNPDAMAPMYASSHTSGSPTQAGQSQSNGARSGGAVNATPSRGFDPCHRVLPGQKLLVDPVKPLPVLHPDPRLWEGTKFMSASTIPPDLTPSLWYHLGCTRARMGLFDGSATAFERAAQCLPSHPAILHELAKAYQTTGAFSRAVQLFDRVLALQPGNANALFRRGLAYRSLKQYDEAARDMEAAKKLDPDNPALQVDYRRLGPADVIELCKPGTEAIVWDLAAVFLPRPAPSAAAAVADKAAAAGAAAAVASRRDRA